MVWLLIREMLEADVLTGKQFDSFSMSAMITDFSAIIASIFYLIMGVVPAAKSKRGRYKNE